MRIVCETQQDTNRVCIRLLGDLAGSVQSGTYIVDGTPQILEPLRFDISDSYVTNDEACLYFAGFSILPKRFVITLPDMSIKYIPIGDPAREQNPVIKSQEEFVAQPIDATPILFPMETPLPKPQTITPPSIPTLWVDLNFNSTHPLRIGTNMLSEELAYTGGGQGRFLSSSIEQPAQDYAPWLLRAPTRLEGEYTNRLQDSDFRFDPEDRGPYLDPTPSGWRVVLSDPMSLLRQQIATDGMPMWTLRFTANPAASYSLSIPSLTIFSPMVVNSGETFQVILLPAKENTSSWVQLKTEDDLYASQPIQLTGGMPALASLTVGSSPPTRVKIAWYQNSDNSKKAQVLQLIAPTSGVYIGGHSWLPLNVISAADFVRVPAVSFKEKWFLLKGKVYTEYAGDTSVTQPPSWSILTQAGDVVLRLVGGVLGSDISGTTLDMAPYFAAAEDVSGYELSWTSLTEDFVFSVRGRDGKLKPPVQIPFRLSTVSDSVLTSALEVLITGYSPTEGSHIITKWGWAP